VVGSASNHMIYDIVSTEHQEENIDELSGFYRNYAGQKKWEAMCKEYSDHRL
jgi:hypothetical protein